MKDLQSGQQSSCLTCVQDIVKRDLEIGALIQVGWAVPKIHCFNINLNNIIIINKLFSF